MNKDNIILNKSAILYTHNNKLSGINFEKVLKEHLKKENPGHKPSTVFFEDSSSTVKYSLAIFKKTHQKPTFFVDIVSNWEETKIGYFLVVFNEKFAIIAKTHTGIPQVIENNVSLISANQLISLRVGQKTKFKNMNMQNLDGANQAIRSKSFAAYDLKNNISTIGSSSYHIRSLRGEQDSHSFSLAMESGRLNDYDSKKPIEQVLAWAESVFNDLEANKENHVPFLTNFAKQEDFNASFKYKPISLLIFVDTILNRFILENESISSDSKEFIQNELKYFEHVQKCTISGQDGKYTLTYQNKSVISLEYRKNKVVLRNKIWKNVEFEFEDEKTNLEKIINDNNLFNVYFSNLASVYSNRLIFTNSRLLENAQPLLKFMKGYKQLADVKYEKFKTESKDEKIARENQGEKAYEGKVDWGEKSIFKFVIETFKKEYDNLICDDCNDEWADFIGISQKRKTVSFFACKYKPVGQKGYTISGTDFQDVIGQSLKNIGNFSPTQKQIEEKIEQWSDNKYYGSRIKKFDGEMESLKKLLDFWQKSQFHPDFKKEACIVVNFIQKGKFDEHFTNFSEKMKDDTEEIMTINEEYAYQQLWILSSFVSICQEAGITPRIICQP